MKYIQNDERSLIQRWSCILNVQISYWIYFMFSFFWTKCGRKRHFLPTQRTDFGARLYAVKAPKFSLWARRYFLAESMPCSEKGQKSWGFSNELFLKCFKVEEIAHPFHYFKKGRKPILLKEGNSMPWNIFQSKIWSLLAPLKKDESLH